MPAPVRPLAGRLAALGARSMVGATLLSLALALVVASGADDGLSLPDTRAASSEAALVTEVEAVIHDLNGDFGVSVYSFKDGRVLGVNSDRQFSAASLYKLLVAYHVYREAERGAISMDDPITILADDLVSSEPGDDVEEGREYTVGDALHDMITWSSNASALALVRVSGGWDAVVEDANALGVPVQTQDEEFFITPSGLANFYQRLVAGSLLDRPFSDEFMQLLLDQQKNDRIPAMLPPGTSVAHKTGELDNSRNDAGIVFGPRSAYVIVLMANGADADSAVQAEAEISRLVYDNLQGH